MDRLATKQTGTWRRRDMRKTNSLIAPGHASASIQMRRPGGRSPDSLLTLLHLANSVVTKDQQDDVSARGTTA